MKFQAKNKKDGFESTNHLITVKSGKNTVLFFFFVLWQNRDYSISRIKGKINRTKILTQGDMISLDF